MSRIGKLPIKIKDGVAVNIGHDNMVTVKGPKGELKRKVDRDIIVKQVENEIIVSRPTEQKRHKSLHGLYRTLINNMIIGVTDGYSKQLEIIGVGFRANVVGQILELSLGFSHTIFFQLPKEIKGSVLAERRQNPVITIEGIDKQLVGQVAAKIRSLKKPEPYKGKGIRYIDEVVKRKAGKTAVAT